MAGDWIKVSIDLPEKPEVLQLTRKLDIEVNEVIGKLIRLWGWFDRNSVDGTVDGAVDGDVDRLLLHVGFASALREVGWLADTEKGTGLMLPNFDRHNGESAKSRALKTSRQSRWRASTRASTKRLPEKRREDNKECPPNGGTKRPNLWDVGVGILMESGDSESRARAFLGKLTKEYGKSAMAEAVAKMSAMGPIAEPHSYLLQLLKKARSAPVVANDLSAENKALWESRHGTGKNTAGN